MQDIGVHSSSGNTEILVGYIDPSKQHTNHNTTQYEKDTIDAPSYEN